jgi:TRAP-type transport system small permease protein
VVSALERWEGRLAGALDGVAILLMATLVVVIAWSVLGRQVLRISVPWAEEVGAGLLAWMVALGAAAVWQRRGHIVIDVLLNRLALRPRFVLVIAIELASLLLLAVAFWGSWSMMFVSAHNRTTALGISYTWLYLALVIGLGAMILFSLSWLGRLLVRGPAMLAAAQKGDEWSTLSSS